MYKLYLSDTRTMIDVSENEQDIIDTMGEYLRESLDTRFMIVFSQEYGDCIYAVINGYIDYKNYLEVYKQKLKDMSCTELKKEITKDVKIKKLKKNK